MKLGPGDERSLPPTEPPPQVPSLVVQWSVRVRPLAYWTCLVGKWTAH
ncbi:MAG: hypothetical protein KME55_25165 [Nostoc indistinguendum CM1-VF10]|nr:hypothetical protein [Nostoc indistinguendum CM1-VF10]